MPILRYFLVPSHAVSEPVATLESQNQINISTCLLNRLQVHRSSEASNVESFEVENRQHFGMRIWACPLLPIPLKWNIIIGNCNILPNTLHIVCFALLSLQLAITIVWIASYPFLAVCHQVNTAKFAA